MSLSTSLPLRWTDRDIALVLGGGGFKGSYQIGVFDALRLLGIRAGFVCGTSVGALNAAMYSLGAIREAEELWEQLRLPDLVANDILTQADKTENMMARPEKLLELVSKYGKQKGLDISPLRELIRKHIPEDQLRISPIGFGLTATSLNGLVLTEKTLPEIAKGSLADWLLASCACFPAFPLQEINGELYADGGFCDNVPVNMALRNGAKHVIAVDIGKQRAHTRYDSRPNVTYIRASRPLGTLLGFDPDRVMFNRGIGRNDTLRAFRALAGFTYSFDPRDAARYRGIAWEFVAEISRLEAALTHGRAVRLHSSESSPLFRPLEDGMTGPREEVSYWLRACELVCDLAGLSPLPVYTMESLREALIEVLPFKEARVLADRIPESAAALFAKPKLSRKLAVTALFWQIQKNGADTPLLLHAAATSPREFLMAFLLRRMFGSALSEDS